MKKITNCNRYDTTVKLLGITTAVLLLLPVMAQPQSQLATAQVNAAAPPVMPGQGDPRTLDYTFAEIENKLPGFAGFFFDGEGKLNVYFTKPDQVNTTQVTAVLSDYLDPADLEKGIVILQGKHAWNKWFAWKQVLRQLFNLKELGITTLDIDEKNQMLVLGFSVLDEEKRSKVAEFLVSNNIPAADVQIVETGPVIELSHNVTVSPLKGGIDIGYGTNSVCTNSFIADRQSNGMRVSVIAGHCETSVDMAGDQTYRQPSGGSNVGTEVANTNIYPGPRWSDSLLWQPSVSSTLGKIYNGGTDYAIVSKKYTQGVGESVCKYGRQTHETCGTIIYTDTDMQSPTYGTLWAQNQANFNCEGGDSGSPTFKKRTGSNVDLYGLVWAKNGSLCAYSPIGNIENDQGTLTVR